MDLPRLNTMIEGAATDLQDASRGSALCALTRSGGSAPAAKYHEGRWAALTELRRACEADEGCDLSVEAQARCGRWQADLDRLTARGADANWRAYLSGGVDALTTVGITAWTVPPRRSTHGVR